MTKPVAIEARLGVDKFQVDEEHAHIRLHAELCAACTTKPCTWACPALLYKLEGGAVKFDHAGCLECGTCRVICPIAGAITWNYPNATFGIQFRHG